MRSSAQTPPDSAAGGHRLRTPAGSLQMMPVGRRRPPWVVLLLVTLVWPAAASAQEDAAATPRFRVGPVGMTPGISASNIGVNTNVFNTIENPQRDFTASFSPQLDSSLRLGRSRLRVLSRVTYNYFRRFASERSLNTEQDVAVSVAFNRVSLSAADRYLNT